MDKVIYRCEKGYLFPDQTFEKEYICSTSETFSDFLATVTDCQGEYCFPLNANQISGCFVMTGIDDVPKVMQSKTIVKELIGKFSE